MYLSSILLIAIPSPHPTLPTANRETKTCEKYGASLVRLVHSKVTNTQQQLFLGMKTYYIPFLP